MRLGDWIELQNLSQAEFGRKGGVRQQLVSKWCSGRAIPRLHHMEMIQRLTAGRVSSADFYADAKAWKAAEALSQGELRRMLAEMKGGSSLDLDAACAKYLPGVRLDCAQAQIARLRYEAAQAAAA